MLYLTVDLDDMQVVSNSPISAGIPRQPNAVQNLIGEFETTCMFRISLVAELSTDHIEKAVSMISAWIFSEMLEG